MIRYIQVMLGAFITILYVGCSATAPDYPDKTTEQLQGVTVWQQLEGATPLGSLHELIVSKELDALIDEALLHNPSLQQTWLTLQKYRLNAEQEDATRYPQADLGYSFLKSDTQDGLHSAALNVSWQIDIWGKLSNTYEAALQESAAQEALFQSAQDTLVAEVAKTWLGVIAATRALQTETQRLERLNHIERFMDARYKNGLVGLEEIHSAHSVTQSSMAAVAKYEQQRETMQRTLTQLLGRLDDTFITRSDQYPDVAIAYADLPMQSMRRRPDLKAAYQNIEAAQSHSKVAYKELLPQFDLQAALQESATSPSKLFSGDPVWSLLAQMSAPLYHGGALRSAAKAADIEVAKAYESYRETLLIAIKEVRDAIANERTAALRQRHINEALKSAMITRNLYEHNYKNGLANLMDLLNVEQQAFDLQAQYDTLIYERLVNRVDLALALGLGAKQ